MWPVVLFGPARQACASFGQSVTPGLLCLQADDFFAPLPQAIITCLRGAPCIATESDTWVLPAEAVISHEGTDAARGLLAQAIALGIPSVNYVHPALPVLYTSDSLRSALGIKLLDTDHLLHLLQMAATQSMLPKLGPHAQPQSTGHHPQLTSTGPAAAAAQSSHVAHFKRQLGGSR